MGTVWVDRFLWMDIYQLTRMCGTFFIFGVQVSLKIYDLMDFMALQVHNCFSIFDEYTKQTIISTAKARCSFLCKLWHPTIEQLKGWHYKRNSKNTSFFKKSLYNWLYTTGGGQEYIFCKANISAKIGLLVSMFLTTSSQPPKNNRTQWL